MISLLLPDLRAGGAERVGVDLANALADLGHKVEFVLMRERGEFLEEARTRHSVVSLNAPRVRNGIVPLVRYFKSRRPDGLIASMWPLTFIAPLAAKLAGSSSPILGVEHSVISRQYANRGKLHRLALRATLKMSALMGTKQAGVSRGAAEDIALLTGRPSDQIAVLHNPIPPRILPTEQEIQAVENLWPLPRGKRLLTVGNLKAVKNHKLLLEAFRLLDDPQACLMIVGQGQMESELKQTSGRLGLADRVIFAGFQANPTPFYMTADLFILSSNIEGFGNVLVEALGCGLPVVSTKCPTGPEEVLADERYGLLTPVGDAEALCMGIRRALETRWDQETLKRRATDFFPTTVAHRYLEVIGL